MRCLYVDKVAHVCVGVRIWHGICFFVHMFHVSVIFRTVVRDVVCLPAPPFCRVRAESGCAPECPVGESIAGRSIATGAIQYQGEVHGLCF